MLGPSEETLNEILNQIQEANKKATESRKRPPNASVHSEQRTKTTNITFFASWTKYCTDLDQNSKPHKAICPDPQPRGRRVRQDSKRKAD